MLLISSGQMQAFDDVLKANFARRLVDELHKTFMAAADDAAGTQPALRGRMPILVQSCRQSAQRLGLTLDADVATLAAYLAGEAQLAPADAAAFRDHVACVFERPGADGAVTLALAAHRLGLLTRVHPFAARLQRQVNQMRGAFA